MKLPGRPSAPPEQWRRVFSMRHHHWRCAGSCTTARNPRNRRDLARLPPLFTFLLAVRIPITCKSRKRRMLSVLVFVLSCSRICFFFFSILGLLFSLQICFSFGFAFFFVSGGQLANGFLAVSCITAGGRFTPMKEALSCLCS